MGTSGHKKEPSESDKNEGTSILDGEETVIDTEPDNAGDKGGKHDEANKVSGRDTSVKEVVADRGNEAVNLSEKVADGGNEAVQLPETPKTKKTTTKM